MAYVPVDQRTADPNKPAAAPVLSPMQMAPAQGGYVPVAKRTTPVASVPNDYKGTPGEIPLSTGSPLAKTSTQAIPDATTGNGLFGAIKDLGQGVTRDAALIGVALGQDILQAFSPALGAKARATTIPVSKTNAMFLGNGNLDTSKFTETAKKYADYLQGTPFKKGATPLAVLGAVLPTSLDFLGGGSTEGAGALFKALRATEAGAEGEAHALGILKGVGFTDDIAKQYAPIFAKATDLDQIRNGVMAAKKLQETTKPIESAATGLYKPVAERAVTEPTVSAVSHAIAPELQPLADEARKYKNVDEFIKAQNEEIPSDLARLYKPEFDGSERFYRGVSPEYAKDIVKNKEVNLPGVNDDDLYFTKDYKYALAYAKGNPEGVVEVSLPKELVEKMKISGDEPHTFSLPGETFGGVGSNLKIKDAKIASELSSADSKKELTNLYNQATKDVPIPKDKLPELPAPSRFLHPDVVDAFAKATDRFEVLDLVQKYFPNLPENMADRMATKLAAETDQAKVAKALKGAAGLDKRVASGEIETGATTEIQQIKPEVEKEVAKTLEADVPKELKRSPAGVILGLGKTEKEQKSWQSILRGYLAREPREKTANILSYFRTPEFELERLGLAKGAEMLQDAKDLAIDLKKEFLDKVIGWKEEVEKATLPAGRADANLRIFRWLDGKARFVQKDMTETELKVAQEIKSWLRELAVRLNLPEEKVISDYITHIFERTSEVNPQESVFDDPDMLALMDQPAKSVYDPFLQARTGKPGYREDTWAALDAYAKRASRKIALDPALEEVANEAKKLDGAAYQYVTDMTHKINMRPSWVDTLIDNALKETPGVGNRFGARPVAVVTKTLRQIFNRGIFGLNFKNALNNLSQGANTYSKLKEKYTVIGYTKLLGRILSGNLEDLYQSHVLEDAFVEQEKKLGVYKSVLQKIDPKLFALQRGAELINRGAAYYGAEAKALAEGLSPEQAIKHAKRIVRETQFSFSAVDAPVGLNSDLAKTLTQTLSYNFKQSEFLGRLARDKDFIGLLRYSFASFIFMQTIGSIYGMTVDQIIPTLGFGGNPTLAVIQDIGDLSFGTIQARAKALSDLKTRLWQLFPAGGQAKKVYEGVKAVSQGKDTTPTGRTRFKIKPTTLNYIRAALFGKSSLPQARDYYDSIGKPKDNKNAAGLPALPQLPKLPKLPKLPAPPSL